jgi:hypothetical protein
MSLVNDMKRAVREMGRRMGLDGRTPQYFVWRHGNEDGVQIPCVPSSLGREVVIDPQGNEAVIDLRLLVDRDQFLTADSTLVTVDSELYTADNETPTPVSGMEIEFRGGSYKIVTATESGTQSHFVLTCMNVG